MLNKLVVIPGYLLFFMMLFIPTTYQTAKLVFLALALGIVAIRFLLKKRLNIHPAILLWALFTTFVGLCFILRGLANGASGAFEVATVYALWPLVFTVLIAGVDNEKTKNALLKILVIGIYAIGLYSLIDILHAMKWLPEYLYFHIDQGQAFWFYNGYAEYSTKTLTSLVFLMSFLTAALMSWPKDKAPFHRLWLWGAFVLGLLVVLLSGRRALLIIIAFSPVISLVYYSFFPREGKLINRKRLVSMLITAVPLVVGLVFVLEYFTSFTLEALLNMVIQGFEFNSDSNASLRYLQFVALISGWLKHPFLGAGLGASVADVVPSVTNSWNHRIAGELTSPYAGLLFQTGLIGFLAYTASIIWMFRQGLRIIRLGGKDGLVMIPLLTGLSSFLIANATNPYLEKFGSMWIIFLPLAFINSWLLNHREEVLAIPKTNPQGTDETSRSYVAAVAPESTEADEAPPLSGRLASLDIVIVNWNSGKQLRHCLESIVATNQDSFVLNRVVVVDNASIDGSADVLEDLNFPLTLITNSVNRGFAAACNQGARESQADYLLFLNPDTRLFNNSLSNPLEFMENPANRNVGILGIQLIDDHKLVSRTCARFPTPETFISKFLGLNRLFPWLFPNHFMTEWDHMDNSLVDQVIGAYFLVRRSLFKELNGFDERYFVYFEELDFSLRARRFGRYSYYLADVQAYHKGNGSTEQVKDLQLFYSLQSRILYIYKHFGWWSGAWLQLMTLILEPWSRLILSLLHRSRKEITGVLKGYYLLLAQTPMLLKSGWQGKSQR